MAASATNDVEIQKLRLPQLNKLSKILDIGDSWKELIEIIPKSGNDDDPLYTAEDVWNFARVRGSPTMALLHDWGRRGKRRPTAKLMMDLLIKIENYRVASMISVDILKGKPIEGNKMKTSDMCIPNQSLRRSPVMSTENVNVGIRTEELCNQQDLITCAVGGVENRNSDVVSSASCVVDGNSNDTMARRFAYSELNRITSHFNEVSYKMGGSKLGEGAFGAVFIGDLAGIGKVAVKRLKTDADIGIQFETEIKVLSRFRHENLLCLLGYSCDGNFCCIVYDFMANGSLQDILACKNGVMPLGWKERVNIAIGTARGINHLHTFGEKPLVHRDIKSANILLDFDYNPKVGDFGLARQGSHGSGSSSTAVMTMKVFGTSVYMPLEAFRGIVSAKLDVYSYGIVLLELLTSLPPHDPNREEDADLLSFISGNCDDILEWVDRKITDLDETAACEIYDLSIKCTNEFPKRRPTMAQVLQMLENIRV